MNTPATPLPARGGPEPSAPSYATAYYGGGMPVAGSSGGLDPFHVARVIRRKWITVSLTFLFILAAAVYYLWTTPKVYRATSLVELSVRRPRILTQQAAVIEDQSAAGQSEEVFNTRLEKFKGRSMLLAAVDRLGAVRPEALRTEEDSPVPDPAADRERWLQRYQSGLKLALIRRSRLVRVEFEDTDPAIAAAACNAFAEAAEASAYDENRISSDAAVVWLEAQAESQRKEVQKADDALLQFRQANRIDALESQRKTVDEALLDFNKSMVEIESREACERDLLAAMEGLVLDPERAGELPAAIPRADEIRGALEKWRAAVAERGNLLTRYTEKHPEVQAKDRVVELYRSQATEALARSKATTQSNRALLTRQAESLRQKKAAQAGQASDLESRIVEIRTRLLTLERSRDAADQAYRGILTRIQDARMAADENTATVKIVEKATVPARAVKPIPVRVVVLAAMLGMLLGSGLALAKDSLEDHVAGPEDLAGGPLPVLAVVPHVKSKDRASVATATLHQKFSQVAEGFAGLRAMLDSPEHKERSGVVLVASSAPGEGKTVTSCNLAAAWARKGKRVLLIDFDLRRPRLAGIFPMPPGQPGLLESLSKGVDQVDGAALAYPVKECPGLHVIATRPFSGGSPAEVVGASPVDALVAWARGCYDHVVLDAPPLGLVSDALTLAPLADFTLVMTRPDVSRLRLTWHTVQRFRESGVHALAFVVNDVDFSKTPYGGYSPYYHYQKHYKVYAPPESRTGEPA